MLLSYRVKVSHTKVTHFTLILALYTCLYRSHLRKPVSMKQSKHSRKSEAQNVYSKCPPITRTHAFKRLPLCNRCRDDVVHGPAASTPSADIVIIISSSIFQLLHIMDPRAVDFLLKHTPDAVVHRIQIWRIRWPHLCRGKLWRLSLQHGDTVTCTMCWCPILLKNVVIPENRADIQQKHRPI